MATWAERLGDAALTEEEIAYASAFYEIAISWSSRERANLRRRREKAEQVDTLLPAYRRAAPARERLQSDPANPAANGRWGAYLCFVRGKWREGLPALALSDDDRLRELAEADLAVGNDPQEMLKVAAEWRDYAEAHEESAAGDGALIAAHYWYSRAAERLQGVEKLRASANAAKISLPAGSSTRNWPLVKQ
jgi:hypothetical protein